MNFIKDGSGFFTLNTPATYDGNTTVSNGFLFSGVNNALPATTSLNVVQFAALDLNAHNQQVSFLAGTGSITNQSATPATFTLTPSTPDVIPTGLFGNLSLNLPNPCNITLTTAALYTGNTSISSPSAFLTSAIPNALPVTTPLILDGVFDINGNDQQLPSVSGNGTITNTAATFANFQLNSSGRTGLSNHLAGNINFTKSGSANLLLITPLNYTGFTTISQGGLALAVDNALPVSTTLFTNPGTTFDLDGHSQQLASLIGDGTIIDSNPAPFLFNTLSIVNNTDVLTFTTINLPLRELVKAGNGTLTLGTQVLAGSTFVNAGACSSMPSETRSAASLATANSPSPSLLLSM